MRHILIIVGEEIHINEPFMDYILKRFKEHFTHTPLISYIGNSDKELPFKIENLAKNYDYLTIIANESNFYTISKILCTLSSDSLELKNDTLMPSRTELFVENSFVAEILEAKINLLKACPNKALPVFLLENTTRTENFMLNAVNKDDALSLLASLADSFNVNIFTSQILPELVLVRATNQKFGQIDEFLASVNERLKKHFIKGDNIAEFIVSSLKAKGLNLSFAESCTAGLVAAKLGSIAGASEVFSGSLVTYSNHIKNVWLGVDEAVLETKGAVSSQCVEQMAKGALNMSGADFAIAISGIAGPGGGSREKPVGLVYIAVANDEHCEVRECHFSGDRDYIREQSALRAYSLLLESFWDEIVE
nr:CinA family protein [uncultured Campylobacter sp.]